LADLLLLHDAHEDTDSKFVSKIRAIMVPFISIDGSDKLLFCRGDLPGIEKRK
jgi:hypothetical protein